MASFMDSTFRKVSAVRNLYRQMNWTIFKAFVLVLVAKTGSTYITDVMSDWMGLDQEEKLRLACGSNNPTLVHKLLTEECAPDKYSYSNVGLVGDSHILDLLIAKTSEEKRGELIPFAYTAACHRGRLAFIKALNFKYIDDKTFRQGELIALFTGKSPEFQAELKRMSQTESLD